MMRSAPRHRSIIAIDIERSTSPVRTNPIREELRHEATACSPRPCRQRASATGNMIL